MTPEFLVNQLNDKAFDKTHFGLIKLYSDSIS